MNYFFLACAFFAFHLLFAYLVDRIPLSIAFVICSIVSMFLTISYSRRCSLPAASAGAKAAQAP